MPTVLHPRTPTLRVRSGVRIRIGSLVAYWRKSPKNSAVSRATFFPPPFLNRDPSPSTLHNT